MIHDCERTDIVRPRPCYVDCSSVPIASVDSLISGMIQESGSRCTHL